MRAGHQWRWAHRLTSLMAADSCGNLPTASFCTSLILCHIYSPLQKEQSKLIKKRSRLRVLEGTERIRSLSLGRHSSDVISLKNTTGSLFLMRRKSQTKMTSCIRILGHVTMATHVCCSLLTLWLVLQSSLRIMCCAWCRLMALWNHQWCLLAAECMIQLLLSPLYHYLGH
jgi:hypothetical protein